MGPIISAAPPLSSRNMMHVATHHAQFRGVCVGLWSMTGRQGWPKVPQPHLLLEKFYHKFIPLNETLGREKNQWMDSNLVGISCEKREPWKASLLFCQCFLNAKVGHGNAAVFHFVVFFWVFTCFRSAFHHASVSKINLNRRRRLSKKIIQPPNEVRSFISRLAKNFILNPLMKVSRIASSISVLKQVRYYHWARQKPIVPLQQDCKNNRGET